MFEKYEKFWVLAIIAIVIYFLYKKQKTGGSCSQDTTASTTSLASTLETPLEKMQSLFGSGSIVNPTLEPKTVQPAQSTNPVLFRPAQPSTVPISTRVSAGTYQWTPQRSPLRIVQA